MGMILFDGTCYLCDLYDYLSPEAKAEAAYREIAIASQELQDRKAESIRFLESIGCRVIEGRI